MNKPCHKSSRRLSSDRGEGAFIFIAFLVGLGVLWFVGDFIISWIYNNKESRIEASHQHGKKGVATLAPTPFPELGSYTKEYNQ
jgi:hypothetical protein